MKHLEKSSKIDPGRVRDETVLLLAEHLRKLDLEPQPDFLPRIASFTATLALWGASTNLTAAPDDPAELVFHILDSLAPINPARRSETGALRDLFGSGQRVLDLGSGAGFPGLVLAAATEARFTLLEARRKRASFLTIAATEMGLTNIEIDSHRRRPEALAGGFDVVTGRAFAEPAFFYRSAGSALEAGGTAILYANPKQPLDQAAAGAAGLAEVGLLAYAVPRTNRKIERILVVLHKR